MAVSTAARERRGTGDDAGAGERQVLPGPGLLGLVAAEGRELVATGPFWPEGRRRMSTL